ncbi:MAG: metalloregulator ArsR/SmtB family transcription factor [Steroidobacteraceae bacterium]
MQLLDQRGDEHHVAECAAAHDEGTGHAALCGGTLAAAIRGVANQVWTLGSVRAQSLLRNWSVARILTTNWLHIVENAMRRDAFQAIADPTRRAIIGLIAQRAMTPNEIADHFDISRQAVSKQLRILAECRLVRHESAGREIYYHFNPKRLQAVADFIEPYRQMWDQRFRQLDQLLLGLRGKNP